jgi:hypothetical protein
MTMTQTHRLGGDKSSERITEENCARARKAHRSAHLCCMNGALVVIKKSVQRINKLSMRNCKKALSKQNTGLDWIIKEVGA